MNRVYAVTRALGILLAIAAAFVVIPNLNVAAALVILGIITGLGVAEENTQRLLIATLVLPVVAIALGNIPQIGEQLSAIAANLGTNVPAKKQAAPEQGSIAVLPFVNMSDEAGQEHFTDGLTEDIITDLSNVPGFFVIARNSVFAYRGKPTDVRQIAYDLGVKYILEGSARRSEKRLRINVQLIDAAEGGRHV